MAAKWLNRYPIYGQNGCKPYPLGPYKGAHMPSGGRGGGPMVSVLSPDQAIQDRASAGALRWVLGQDTLLYSASLHPGL